MNPSVDEKVGEMPITLNVSVLGNAGDGEPNYLEEPNNAKEGDDNSANSSDGINAVVFAGIGAALLALLALIWAFLRRKRTAE